MKPRKLKTPHKDEATEAEDAEWDPDDDEDRRVKRALLVVLACLW